MRQYHMRIVSQCDWHTGQASSTTNLDTTTGKARPAKALQCHATTRTRYVCATRLTTWLSMWYMG